MVKNGSPWFCRLDCCFPFCLSRPHYLGSDSIDIKKVEYFVFISHTAPNSFVVCVKGVLCTVPSPVHWNASRTALPSSGSLRKTVSARENVSLGHNSSSVPCFNLQEVRFSLFHYCVQILVTV